MMNMRISLLSILNDCRWWSESERDGIYTCINLDMRMLDNIEVNPSKNEAHERNNVFFLIFYPISMDGIEDKTYM